MPRDLDSALDNDDDREMVTRIVLAVSLRVSMLFLIPTLLAIGLAWHEAGKRAEAIDKSRAEALYTSCLGTNDRHDRTIDQLDKIIATRKGQLRAAIKNASTYAESEALRGQLDAIDDSKATTISLIEAIVPYQNCEKLVADRIGLVPS